MQTTIRFDPDQDEVQDVLATVAVAFRTTLDDLFPEQRTDEPDTGTTIANVGAWTPNKARKALQQLAPGALRMVALVTVAGFVTRAQAREYLGVRDLRGLFSSCTAAVRNTRGLPEHEKFFTRVNNPYWGYAMPEDKRALFREVFQETDQLELLADARAYAKKAGVVQ